jgi:drug/metabolite transporter (DMT)-like permease
VTKKRKLAYLALLGNVVIWGAALPIVKPALHFITPYYFLQLRYIIASIFMVPLLLFVWPEKHAWKRLVYIIPIETVAVILGLTFLYKGLEYTPALTASLIGSTAPIFVTLGGIFFLHEREEKKEWLGLGLSVLGTLLILFSATGINHLATHNYIGLIYLGLYHIANVAYLLLAKRFYHQENKLFVTAIECLVGLIGFSFLAPLLGPTPPVAMLLSNPAVIRAVLYMGILGTPVAVTLLLYGQSKIEVSEASLFTYLQPLIFIPLSVLWLGDRLYPTQLLGLILIVAGVYLAESRRRRPKQKPTLP